VSEVEPPTDEAPFGRDPSRKPKTWGNLREYSSLVRWLVPNVVRHAGARIVGVMLLSIVSVGSRVATVGAVAFYVNAQTSGAPVELLGVSIPSGASLLAYAVWGGAALAFAALDVAARSWGDRINFRIAESYASLAMQDLLRHAAVGDRFDAPTEITLPSRMQLIGIMQLDSQRLVRVLVQVLSLPTPLIMFTAVAGYLIYVNTLLTLALIPLVGGYSLAVGAINRRMLRDSQRRRLAMPLVRRDLYSIAMTLMHTRYSREAIPGWLSTFPRKSWMERSVRAFRGMWFARRRVQYLRDAFNGISLFLIVMVFGTLLASDETPWTMVLTYIVALGYGVQSMDKFSRLLTAANRQVPHVRRYVWFMQTYPELVAARRENVSRPGSNATGPLVVASSGTPLQNSLAEVELAAGNPTFCAYDSKLDSRAVGALCTAFAAGDLETALDIESQVFSLERVVRLPERPLRRLLPAEIGAKEGLARVREIFSQLGLADEFEERIGGLEQIFTEERDDASSAAFRYAIRLVPGLLTEARFVFLGWDALAAVEAGPRQKILHALRNQIVVLVPSDPSMALPDEATRVVVVSNGEVRGIGDRSWHEQLRAAGQVTTPRWLIEAREFEVTRAAQNTEDIYDDEDEDEE